MADAYVEFLTENSQRNYPFAEDASLTSGAFRLPNDVVLDFRGFSRQRPVLIPHLESIMGQAAPAQAGQPASAGNWTLVFRAGLNHAFRCEIPVTNAQWPFVSRVKLQDPVYAADYPDVNIGGISVTVGRGIQAIQDVEGYTFIPTATPLEPSLFVSLYRQVLDYLRLVHSGPAPDDVIGRAVKTYGGYNCFVNQSTADKTLAIGAQLGAGRLGYNLDPGTGQSACRGFVFQINGIKPDAQYDFKILAGEGIRVENLPDEHKIKIIYSPERFPGKLNCQI
jgi:hypothetical protein